MSVLIVRLAEAVIIYTHRGSWSLLFFFFFSVVPIRLIGRAHSGISRVTSSIIRIIASLQCIDKCVNEITVRLVEAVIQNYCSEKD